jgi:hypothetical protein
MMGRQFPLGVMDPDQPPVVLLGPDKRVIGVEWEAANRGQSPPQLHGQTANLGPPHPGVDQPHYMLHAYFRTDGKVLFGDFNPALAAPGMPNTGAGGSRGETTCRCSHSQRWRWRPSARSSPTRCGDDVPRFATDGGGD